MVSGGLLTSAGMYTLYEFIFLISALLYPIGGVLSLLDDEEEEIQVFALTRLDELVDVFWAEISESIRKMLVYNSYTIIPILYSCEWIENFYLKMKVSLRES